MTVTGTPPPAMVTVEIPKDLLDRYDAIWAKIQHLDRQGQTQSATWWDEHESLSEVRIEIMDAIMSSTRAPRQEAHDDAA